jgi:sugar/nucleoside kinase (ribokinase family)
MIDKARKTEIRTAAADLVSPANSLIAGDHYASMHLARLLAADESDACRLFARAVAERLQQWPTRMIPTCRRITI